MGIADTLSQAGLNQTSPYVTIFKRTIDTVLAAVLILMLLPLLLLITGLIALDGHAPIYRQRRVGRGNSEFVLWKFRSMVPDADAKLADYLDANPAAAAEWHDRQKLAHDPRITPVGRILRKTSLDELPQLWNVVKGDMSLVGPRPYLTTQKDLYPGKSGPRLRPGLTGLWQVEARNLSSFADRFLYDTRYEETASFWLDCSILAKTAAVVLKGTGC